MKHRRLFWQIFPPFVIVTALLLAVDYWYTRGAIEDFHRREVTETLLQHARSFEVSSGALLERRDAAGLGDLARRLGQVTDVRFTIVLPSGKVLAESHEDPEKMDDHRSRPEIAAALRTGNYDWSVRTSPTLRQPFLYVAYPVEQSGHVACVIRTAQTLAAVNGTVAIIGRNMLAFGGVALAASILVGWWLARHIARPLETLTAGAARFGAGELNYRLAPSGSWETSTLAEAMNDMARQLRDQMQTIVRQQAEQDIVLHSMVEGVLAVDRDGRILDLNDAGQRMFQLDAAQVRGRYLHEVVRRQVLLRFVEEVQAQQQPQEKELVIHDKEPRTIVAYGNLLRSVAGENIGVLVVLREETEYRKLEKVRREFVANASHEMRTPITSIKGFLETVLESEPAEPPEKDRFLRIALHETDRLIAILDDILSLARIEKETERREITLERGPLTPVVVAAVERCQPAAQARGMSLAVDCPAQLEARFQAGLLEQALVNLLDNAIKYSGEGTAVQVVGRCEGQEVRLDVCDQGPGIEARHLPRLFERFYRVDSGRSRQAGGTGLGLAIVKHIALAHGGWVSVESKPGQGSRFSIHLPAVA